MKRLDISNHRTRLSLLFILMAGVVVSMVLVFMQSRQAPAVISVSPQAVVTPKAPAS